MSALQALCVHGEVGFEGLGCRRSRLHRAEVVEVALPVELRGVALDSDSAKQPFCICEELSAGSGGDGGEGIAPFQKSRLIPCAFWRVHRTGLAHLNSSQPCPRRLGSAPNSGGNATYDRLMVDGVTHSVFNLQTSANQRHFSDKIPN